MKLTFTQLKKLVRRTIKEAIEYPESGLNLDQPAPTVPVFGGGVEVEPIFDQEKKEFFRRAKTIEELNGTKSKNKYAEQLYALGVAKKNNNPTILRPYKEKIVDIQRIEESEWIKWLSEEWPDFQPNDWMAIATEIYPNVHDSFINTQRLESKKQKTEKLRQATEKNMVHKPNQTNR